MVPGFPHERDQGACTTIQNRRCTFSTSLLQTTWGGRIHTLHLNYVAGYTGPLIILFERTYNYPVHNQELLP